MAARTARAAPEVAGDVTRLLQAWRRGEPLALDQIMERVHPELRRIAANHFRRERGGGATLQPTAVVHEAYVRLLSDVAIDWQSRRHFYAVASRVMRRVLVDHARARGARKRRALTVTLQEAEAGYEAIDVDVLALEDALAKLEHDYPAQAQVVQLRFFGGLSIDETAEELHISHATVERSWSFARAWLSRELLGTGAPRGEAPATAGRRKPTRPRRATRPIA